MNLSVVIPAYNEEKDIEAAVRDVIKALPDAEIIVVNDASTDTTLQILTELQAGLSYRNLRVISNNMNEGHGYSVVKGLREATGDYILYIDADRQIGLDNLQKVVEGYDVISGWRMHRYDKPFRKAISFCLKTTNLFRHRMYIYDANCPFKLYKRSSLLPLLNELPTTYIVPIACLEVLARKHKLQTRTIRTPHLPYEGERKGFLQILNLSALKFFSDAFFEVVSL